MENCREVELLDDEPALPAEEIKPKGSGKKKPYKREWISSFLKPRLLTWPGTLDSHPTEIAFVPEVLNALEKTEMDIDAEDADAITPDPLHISYFKTLPLHTVKV